MPENTDEPGRERAVQNGYCATQPQPGSYMSSPCPDCGHAVILHVGTTHCPVCEMVDLNRRAADAVAQWRKLLDPREREREALRAALRNPLIARQFRR